MRYLLPAFVSLGCAAFKWRKGGGNGVVFKRSFMQSQADSLCNGLYESLEWILRKS